MTSESLQKVLKGPHEKIQKVLKLKHQFFLLSNVLFSDLVLGISVKQRISGTSFAISCWVFSLPFMETQDLNLGLSVKRMEMWWQICSDVHGGCSSTSSSDSISVSHLVTSLPTCFYLDDPSFHLFCYPSLGWQTDSRDPSDISTWLAPWYSEHSILTWNFLSWPVFICLIENF